MAGEKAVRPEQILHFPETKRRAESGRERNVVSDRERGTRLGPGCW